MVAGESTSAAAAASGAGRLFRSRLIGFLADRDDADREDAAAPLLDFLNEGWGRDR